MRYALLLTVACLGCVAETDPPVGFRTITEDTSNPQIVANAKACLAETVYREYAACCFLSPRPDRYNACRGACCARYADCLTRSPCQEVLRVCLLGDSCQDPADPLAYYEPALAGCFQRSAEVMKRDGNACQTNMALSP